jgi:hypothetical protein
MPGNNEGYVVFDEFADTVASLELIAAAIPQTETQPRMWKWVLLAAHSALQGACVAILTRTDGSGALDGKSECELRNYYENGAAWKIENRECGQTQIDIVPYPEQWLAALPVLVERLPDGLGCQNGERLARKGKFKDSDFRRLHAFRNNFAHFAPASWAIERAGLPRITLRAIDLSEQIIRSDSYFRYNRFIETDALALIEKIRGLMPK